MAKFMTNSVIDFDQMGTDTGLTFTDGTVDYDLEDYTSFNFKKMHEYIDDCEEDFFTWHIASDGDKIEKISYDIYGTTKYWDILILLNKRNPLFDMSYNFDTRSDIATERVQKYNDTVRRLTTSRKAELFDEIMEDLDQKNEGFRAVKIVQPLKISEFIRKGYKMGCFK